MSKLIAIFKQPADPAAFDHEYFHSHLPLIDQVPGLQKRVVTRFTRTLMGEELYMMAEMYFADRDALKTAMKSTEMNEAGTQLNSFAEGLVIMMYGEEEQV